MRLRTALVIWGLLALAGWFVVLVPAYIVIDQAPVVVQALFGDDEAPATDLAQDPDPAALGRIAPAAGGND